MTPARAWFRKRVLLYDFKGIFKRRRLFESGPKAVWLAWVKRVKQRESLILRKMKYFFLYFYLMKKCSSIIQKYSSGR